MTATISGLTTYQVSFVSSISITGSGTIDTPSDAALSDDTGSGTVDNSGKLSGGNFGVSLGLGGVVVNLEGAEISGAVGVDISGVASLENSGVISGGAYGVILGTTALTNEVSGRILGGANLSSGTLTNEGTIGRAEGNIVQFDDGGTVLNLGSAAALTGGAVVGVEIAGKMGTVVNQGAISGVVLGAGGTVTNSGYISTGVLDFGVVTTLGAGEVDNTGHIVGVSLLDGGGVSNAADGIVSGYTDGVDLAAGGTLQNAGQVLGTGGRFGVVQAGNDGVSMSGSGAIVNDAGALIEGSNTGVTLGGTQTAFVTVTNYGTIIGKKGLVVDAPGGATIYDYGTIAGTGGTAVAFEAGNDTLVLEPGSVLDGIVVGGDPSESATLTIDGTLSGQNGSIQLAANGNLVISGPLASTETISFAGTDATLMIKNADAFTSEISGMSWNDTIDLENVSFSHGASLSLLAHNVLEILNGSDIVSLQLDPTQYYDLDFFHISSDGLNGTDINESAVPCFLEDTRIASADGDVRVQDLRIGGMILTGRGAPRPVKWIGRRSYSAPLPNDPDVVPVLIKAEALAVGVPANDLYISPQHAVRVDGYLVPAGALINGVSVLSCPQIDQMNYYHIELATPDTLFANGAEAETFIDHDSRKMFDNADEFYQLYPQAEPAEFVLCLPRLEYGPELEAARRRVAMRAGLLLDQAKNDEVIGFLEKADRQIIIGWAYAPARPNIPVMLNIYNRGALLARTVANIPRPDVKNAGFGHGRCGFQVVLPAPLPALMRHEISVQPVNFDKPLKGSPFVIDPGVAHDLLLTGGLKTLIDAAVQGLTSQNDIVALGDTLEATGRRIRLAARPSAPIKPSAEGDIPVALVIDEDWPTVTRDAGSNAILSHVEALISLGYEVVFCAAGGAPADDDAAAGLRTLRELGLVCLGQDGTAVEQIIRSYTGRRLDIVYLHRLAMASAYGAMVRQHTHAKLVYAVADLHHLRLARQAEVNRRPDLARKARSIKAAEFWAMRLADCVISHSRYEAEYLQREVPRANVHVVPWAVQVSPHLGSGRDRRDIAFIGGAGHAPNLDAVSYLAQEIMPLIWKEAPEMRCLIAGPGWAGNLFKQFDPRIECVGHVAELPTLLRSVRLTVAPLRFGAGLKGKVLESMAAGTPCVMSHIAAEGLPLDPHLRGAVGDGTNFAQNVLAVYKDKKLNRVLVQAGRDMIETCFSKQEVAGALARALGKALPESKATKVARRLVAAS